MISLLLTIILVGVLLYLAEMIPMDATVKQVLRVVVLVVLILWILGVLGLLPLDLPVPRVR